MLEEFRNYEVVGSECNVQKRGEHVCELVAILRTKVFSESQSPNSTGFLTRDRLKQEWPMVMKILNDREDTRDYRIRCIELAMQSEICLALRQKFGISNDSVSSILQVSIPLDPGSITRFKRFLNYIFKECNDQQKFAFFSRSFVYVNSLHRGKLNDFGKAFVNFVAERTYGCSSTFIMPKSNGEYQLDRKLQNRMENVNAWATDIVAYIKNPPEETPEGNISYSLAARSCN